MLRHVALLLVAFVFATPLTASAETITTPVEITGGLLHNTGSGPTSFTLVGAGFGLDGTMSDLTFLYGRDMCLICFAGVDVFPDARASGGDIAAIGVAGTSLILYNPAFDGLFLRWDAASGPWGVLPQPTIHDERIEFFGEFIFSGRYVSDFRIDPRHAFDLFGQGTGFVAFRAFVEDIPEFGVHRGWRHAESLYTFAAPAAVPVPEPATLWLLGSGLVVGYRRARRA